MMAFNVAEYISVATDIAFCNSVEECANQFDYSCEEALQRREPEFDKYNGKVTPRDIANEGRCVPCFSCGQMMLSNNIRVEWSSRHLFCSEECSSYQDWSDYRKEVLREIGY